MIGWDDPKDGAGPSCGAGPFRLVQHSTAGWDARATFSPSQARCFPYEIPERQQKKLPSHPPEPRKSRCPMSPRREASRSRGPLGQVTPVPRDIFRDEFRSKQFPVCSPAGTMPGILIPRLLRSRRDARGSSRGGEQTASLCCRAGDARPPSPAPAPQPGHRGGSCALVGGDAAAPKLV